MTMASINNKSRYAILYEAAVYYVNNGSVRPMPTPVCGLHPGLSTFESWPYGVLFFAFGNLRSVPESEAAKHGCR
jgi:hypothetical protein